MIGGRLADSAETRSKPQTAFGSRGPGFHPSGHSWNRSSSPRRRLIRQAATRFIAGYRLVGNPGSVRTADFNLTQFGGIILQAVRDMLLQTPAARLLNTYAKADLTRDEQPQRPKSACADGCLRGLPMELTADRHKEVVTVL